MKRIFIFMSLLLFAIVAKAQDVHLTVSDGIQNQTVKQRMERGLSNLLNEVNRACAQERPLNLDQIDMALSGKHSLQALWQNLHFFCVENDPAVRCLKSAEGYVVREIFVEVNPLTEDYNDETERALTIRFTREGQIASVAMAVSDAIYGRILERGVGVDMERRMTILSFVENYRSFYDEKDLASIDRVFSDDAIIITGTVPRIHRDRASDIQNWRDQISYKVQDKPQYLSSLAATFKRNNYIKVTFSDVEVVRHPANPNYYGVTLHQHWKSSTYEDDGYLLLIWEFRDGEDPIIHYRTWQPDRIGTHTLGKDEIINIMDFSIPTLD